MRQLVLYQGGIFFKVEDFCFHTIQSPIWPSQRILCKCLMHIALTMFWLHGSRYWLNPLHLLSLSKTKIVFVCCPRPRTRRMALNAKIHGTECKDSRHWMYWMSEGLYIYTNCVCLFCKWSGDESWSESGCTGFCVIPNQFQIVIVLLYWSMSPIPGATDLSTAPYLQLWLTPEWQLDSLSRKCWFMTVSSIPQETFDQSAWSMQFT